MLVPPILRARGQQSRSDSVGDFHHKLSSLGQRQRAPDAADGASSSPQPIFVPGGSGPATMSATQKRRRDVLFVLLGVVAARSSSRCSRAAMPFIVLQLLADVALAGYVYLLIQYKNRTQDQRSKVGYLGAAYRDPSPYMNARYVAGTAGAERSTAGPAPANGLQLAGGVRPLEHSGQIAAAGDAAQEVLEQKHDGTRGHARGVPPRDPLLRVGDPRGAPAGVPRSPCAHRRGGRVPGRGGERARGPQRRALRRIPPRRQEGIRRGQPDAGVRRGQHVAHRRRARGRRAALPQRHGRGRERAAPAGPRLPAARRAATRPSGCSR